MPTTKRKRPPMQEFVRIMNAEMRRQDIGHSELSHRAGGGRAYLYRVLKKKQTPSIEWAGRVAAVLGIKISFTAD